MVQGVIEDFYTATKGNEKSVVKFLVRSEEKASDNGCTISAEIPNDALKFDMLKTGSMIYSKDTRVFIEIEGVEDVAFKKVGNAGGDEVTFYEQWKTITELEERGSKGV